MAARDDGGGVRVACCRSAGASRRVVVERVGEVGRGEHGEGLGEVGALDVSTL
ncbi:MAG: hypothetical protein ACYCUM_13495 [Solirubrobacteraceae bacterium]